MLAQALRQESRWEKPPIREGWMEWRDANGNAFYVDGNGGSTWDPPWADEDADRGGRRGRRRRARRPTRLCILLRRRRRRSPGPEDRRRRQGAARLRRLLAEATKRAAYAPPRPGTDLLAYERQRAALLVAAYRERSAASRERRLRDDREALDRDRAALDRERQLLALERLRDANGVLPARATVAALVVATGLARNQ